MFRMMRNDFTEETKRIPHSAYNSMRLSIIDSTGTTFEEGDVAKLNIEGMEGSFCLLPHHIDYLSILVPGIISYTKTDETVGYFAVSEGVLNKNNDVVRISTLNAIYSDSLEQMKQVLQEALTKLVDEDKDARKAVLQLEYNIMMTLMKSRR